MKILNVKQATVKRVRCRKELTLRSVLTCKDAQSAKNIDEILPLVFQSDGYGTQSELNNNPDYGATIKEIITEENHYLRQLHLISKVFRDFILMKSKALKIDFEDRLGAIFSNINEIITLTTQVIIYMEDLLEIKEEDGKQFAGDFFWEVAETMMFDVYVKFSEDIVSEKFKRTFEDLRTRPDVSNDVKFYLPMLLQEPIYHFFHYHKYIKNLMNATLSEEENHSLVQVLGMINDPLYKVITTVMQMPGYFGSIERTPIDVYHHQLEQKTKFSAELNVEEEDIEDTEGSITNWPLEVQLDYLANNIYQGSLMVQEGTFKQRYVFLFQNILVITKQNKSAIGDVNSVYHYKDSYLTEKIEIRDREDTNERVHLEKSGNKIDKKSSLPNRAASDASLFAGTYIPSRLDGNLNNAFEIIYSEKDRKEEIIVFKADSADEKNAWMAALFMLKSKPTLEAALDSIILKERNNNPLRLPSAEKYPFVEPDSPENILFETNEASRTTIIKGQQFETRNTDPIKAATIVKLVEKMTHPSYSSPKMIKSFLITFRSFSNPNELLDLLIKRFKIPEPEWLTGDTESDVSDLDETAILRLAIEQKRFRNEFVKPVQTIVLNVLKHWVSQHFYDFENDKNLFYKLKIFLEDIESTPLKGKYTEMIRKNIRRKRGGYENNHVIFTFVEPQPEIQIHLELQSEPEWPELLIYHPTEIARQLTLLDFEYFRSVKPNELVDCAWMDSERKYEKSPNVMEMIEQFNNLTNYFQKSILDTKNLEERQAIMNRILEIMVAFQDINNFNGMFAITAVMESASIHRLQKTKDGIRKELSHKLQEVLSLSEKHHSKYMERLHQINPPVVPYFGTYLDRLFKFEEGNPNFITCSSSKDDEKRKLINFYKRAKVAEQISEIQQYQHKAYNFKVYPSLRKFFECLNPFPDLSKSEVGDFLYNKSKEIEPYKDVETVCTERKWPGLQLLSQNLLARRRITRRSANPSETSHNVDRDNEHVRRLSGSLPATPCPVHLQVFSPTEPWRTMAINPMYVSLDAPIQLNENVPCLNPVPLPPRARPPLPPKYDITPTPPPRPPR